MEAIQDTEHSTSVMTNTEEDIQFNTTVGSHDVGVDPQHHHHDDEEDTNTRTVDAGTMHTQEYNDDQQEHDVHDAHTHAYEDRQAEDVEQSESDPNEVPAYVYDVTCSVTVQPEQFTHTDVFPNSLSISALRTSLAKSFRTSVDRVEILIHSLEDRDISDWTLGDAVDALKALGHTEAGSPEYPIQLEMHTHDNTLLDEAVEVDNQPPVDVIRVAVRNDEGEAVIFIRIVKEYLTRTKPFLGGWRNKRNGKTYHHASTQTMKKNASLYTLKYHRTTQTAQTETRSVQTKRDGTSQTYFDKPDIGRVDNVKNDKYITPKKYITADEVIVKRHQYAGEIQGYLRSCFAHRRIRRLRIELAQKEAAELENEKREAEQKRQELIDATERRMHPMTKKDFAVLNDELAAWKQHQIMKIKTSDLSAEEKHFLILQVLGKELAVTQITERLRQEALQKRREALIDTKLAKMCGGLAWQGNGSTVIVDTPHTLHAKELVTVYKGLQSDLSTSERFDVLAAVKMVISEFNTDLTNEIKLLCEREEDLLHRGRSKESLSGLRKRICQLFLSFINTPEYNPQAAMFTAD